MQHRTDSTDQKEKMFERSGFRTQFYGTWFDFHLPTAITCSSEISKGMNAEINRIDEVDQRALVVYDTSVFGFERQASLSKWPRVTGSHARMAVDGELDGWLHSCKTYLQTWLQTWTPLCGFYSNRREVVEVFVWRTYSESSSSWLFWCDHKERPLKLVKLRAAFLYRCKATSKYMLWKAVWYYWYLSWVTCKGTDYSRTFIQRSSCLVIWIQFYICIY